MRRLISRFDKCWIPDFADPEINLSGKLSHRYQFPSNARFVGILSRFSDLNCSAKILPGSCYDIAVILSGPEPQISEFEHKVYQQLRTIKRTAILIRGMRNKPLGPQGLQSIEVSSSPDLYLVSHLEATDFSNILKQAVHVVSRSGYSGIMDYVALGIPAILVPTPGQSEQEYLAKWLSDNGWFTSIHQDELNLAAMPANEFPNRFPIRATQDFQFVEDLYQEYYKNSY